MVDKNVSNKNEKYTRDNMVNKDSLKEDERYYEEEYDEYEEEVYEEGEYDEYEDEDEYIEENLLCCVGSRVLNGFDKSGVRGVKVTLYKVANNEVTDYSAYTNNKGEYLIEYVDPGEYYAVFDPGADYEFILEGGRTDSIGRSRSFSLESGESNLTINALIIKNTGSIRGKLFKDVKLGSNIFLEGQKVVLLDEKGKIKEKISNDSGGFYFSNVLDGKYTLLFKDSERYKCITPKALQIEIKNGREYVYANAVYEKIDNKYSIEGRVFLEELIRGVLKSKDTLVNGIIVELYSGEKVIKKTLTYTINGVIGTYKFDNLLEGLYRVRFVIPSEVKFGKMQNVPYGSKVNETTGVAEVNLTGGDEVDINASIVIR